MFTRPVFVRGVVAAPCAHGCYCRRCSRRRRRQRRRAAEAERKHQLQRVRDFPRVLCVLCYESSGGFAGFDETLFYFPLTPTVGGLRLLGAYDDSTLCHSYSDAALSLPACILLRPTLLVPLRRPSSVVLVRVCCAWLQRPTGLAVETSQGNKAFVFFVVVFNWTRLTQSNAHRQCCLHARVF